MCSSDLRGNARDAATIRKAIQQGGLDELPAVLAAVNATDALNYVRDLATNEVKLACEAIAHLPESANKQALIDLAEFAVTRNF